MPPLSPQLPTPREGQHPSRLSTSAPIWNPPVSFFPFLLGAVCMPGCPKGLSYGGGARAGAGGGMAPYCGAGMEGGWEAVLRAVAST